MTQPVEWHDAGVALENPELAGVHMPKGGGQDVNPPGTYLRYNEVSTATCQRPIDSYFFKYIVYSASQIRLRESGAHLFVPFSRNH